MSVAAQPEYQVESALVLDCIIRKRVLVLQWRASVDQPRVVRADSCLVLNLDLLGVGEHGMSMRRVHIKWYGKSSRCRNKRMQGRFHNHRNNAEDTVISFAFLLLHTDVWSVIISRYHTFTVRTDVSAVKPLNVNVFPASSFTSIGSGFGESRYPTIVHDAVRLSRPKCVHAYDSQPAAQSQGRSLACTVLATGADIGGNVTDHTLSGV